MVSISTVALIVLLRHAERFLRVNERRRSTGAPRDGSRSSAGRSRGRCRAQANSLALWKKNRPKSNSAPDIGSPSTSTCFSEQMPAARAHEQHRGLVVQRVMPPGCRIVEGDRAAHRVAQVDLAFDQVVPGRRGGVLEVGHEDIGAAVERVDHHLAVGRAGDLDPAIVEVARDRRHPPVAIADRLGLGQKIGLPAGIEPLLDCSAAAEQTPPLRTEFALKLDGKVDRLRCQHVLIAGLYRPANDYALALDATGAPALAAVIAPPNRAPPSRAPPSRGCEPDHRRDRTADDPPADPHETVPSRCCRRAPSSSCIRPKSRLLLHRNSRHRPRADDALRCSPRPQQRTRPAAIRNRPPCRARGNRAPA